MNRLVAKVVDRPGLCIATVIVLTLLLGFGVTRLKLRTDGAAIYPRHNAVVEQTEADRATFYDPPQVILLVTSKPHGPAVASPDGFRYLKRVDQSVRSLPSVRGDGVRSLASLPDIQANLKSMSLGTFLDTIPTERRKFAALIDRIRQHPLTNGLFLSTDGQAAAFYIPLAENAQRKDLLLELRRWQSGQQEANFSLRLTGPLVAEATLGEMVLRDLAWLIPIMVLVIAVLLFFTLRTISGIVIPLLEALLVLLWTLGLMGYVGAPITLVTTILPVILMTMAITDEIHLLQRIQSHLLTKKLNEAKPAINRNSLKQATLASIREVGRPIIGTSLTTSIGFLSFLTASMTPMQHFGLFTAFGITTAMMLSFTFIPALVVMLPVQWFVPGRTRASKTSTAPVAVWERAISRHGWVGLVIGVLLLGVSIPGLMRLTVQDSWVDNFDPQSELATAERDFNARFWGSYRFDVVFEGDEAVFFRPEGVALMERFSRLAHAGPHVGGVVSYLVPFGGVAREIGEDSLVSLSEEQINDVAMLAGMSTDPLSLVQLITENGHLARAGIFVNSPNFQRSQELEQYMDSIMTTLANQLNALGVTYHFSGDIPVAMEVVRSIVTNQLRSVSWTLAGIALLLLLVFARGRAGLIALVPVTTAAMMIFAGMGYFGLPLGIATSMFASLTIGVGVDFALHFLHNYQRERLRTDNHQSAMVRTFAATGQAIRWNVLVLALGFLVLTFSTIKPDRSLGLLLAAAMIACYVTTLLFLPRLLRCVKVSLEALCLIALCGSAQAGEPNPSADDHSALTLMGQLEMDFRRVPRIVKMEFSTTFSKRKRYAPVERTLWAICNGDTSVTQLLNVIVAPSRMQGTTLLFADHLDPDQPDSTWLYLVAFKRISHVTGKTQRALVPGTALSYEDSRGFIPVEKYDFQFFGRAPDANSPRVTITATPKTEQLREDLGVSSLTLQIDTRKRLITRVDYVHSGGKIFKTYRTLQSVELSGIWLPQQVKVDHIVNGIHTTADYQYWPLTTVPESELFRTDGNEHNFFENLKEILEREGLDSLLTTGSDDSTAE